ncbi:MAG: hydrogenase iron-sulfur subunit [Chloroflexota bacterium]|nr:hydrogenase iron-sulfur subunit [Chloroflexota bacterium]
MEEERLHLDWVSASEGARFADVVNDMTARIKELGPLRQDEKELDAVSSH